MQSPCIISFYLWRFHIGGIEELISIKGSINHLDGWMPKKYWNKIPQERNLSNFQENKLTEVMEIGYFPKRINISNFDIRFNNK